MRDDKGTTALEFGMVAGPFLIFVFSIAGLGLYWLATSQLNYAVSTAARQIRTGEAQRSNKTAAEFKQMVCDQLTTFINCDSKLQIHVQSFDNWADVNPVSCIAAGGTGLRPPSGNPTDSLTVSAGEASEVVLVTVCHEWELAKSMPWLFLAAKNKVTGAQQLGGSALIQATTIFRTEPYQ